MNRGMLSPFSMIQAVTISAFRSGTRYAAFDLAFLESVYSPTVA